MHIHQLLNALQEMKQKFPIYDFNHFTVKVDGKDIAQLSLSVENFAINLSTTVPEPAIEPAIEPATKSEE